MVPRRPDASYEIQRDGVQKVSIKIAEAACTAENLSLVTWSSSHLLSNLLHTFKIDLANSRGDEFSIVELGAGTGLTGLSAAAVWSASTLLTELPGIVPGLQKNIQLNSDIIQACGGSVSCGTLDWYTPEDIHISNPDGTSRSLKVADLNGFPVVLAADTMYTEEHPRLLSHTIAKCLRRSPQARAIICHPLRIAYLDHTREFWEMMQDKGLVADEEGRQECELDNFDDEKLHEWSIWKWKDLE